MGVHIEPQTTSKNSRTSDKKGTESVSGTLLVFNGNTTTY